MLALISQFNWWKKVTNKLTPKQVEKIPASTGSKQASTQFKPGQSGNPNGRVKGSRNKLADKFITDIYHAWQDQGKSVILKVIADKPDVFLRTVAGILPKEMHINVNKFEGMTDAQLVQQLEILDELIQPILADGFGGTDEEGNSGETKH
ncbi:MAG: hypothetical protein GY943_30530 [Chloroflexi bacterium]|nr:hypothetical protein [Chloroflexota bacterium]